MNKNKSGGSGGNRSGGSDGGNKKRGAGVQGEDTEFNKTASKDNPKPSSKEQSLKSRPKPKASSKSDPSSKKR